MAYKKWKIADADKARASELSEKFNIDPFAAFLLVSRGISSDIEVSDFLSSSCGFGDPFELSDMDKAVERIEQAIDYQEKITVYGDYDCDGVTAASLLFLLLRDMGADVDYYIPSREDEGYGISIFAADKLKENGTRLIITVDNGIAAVEEAKYISSLGMELVITDHHQIGDALPEAVAVVNPHREDNGDVFHDLAGVGVAFKLACALYGDTQDMLSRFADLVAIGTVGDSVPLRGENRGLVRAGLEKINSGMSPAVQALKKAAGAEDKALSATGMAFFICPRVNAAGRVDSAYRAVELFTADDYETAVFKAQQLNIDNSHRQELETEIFESVKQMFSENPSLAQDRVIVIASEKYRKGVAGLAAARICEEYSKPAVVLCIDENGVASGSARSVEGFNIFEATAHCAELLDKFGGHPMAAGLSLPAGNVPLFKKRINEYAAEKFPQAPVQTVNIDCKLSPFYLDLELVKSLKLLEPFGEGNPEPVFALSALNIVSVTPSGNGKHIRLECEKKGKIVRMVKFKCTPDEFPFTAGDRIDAAVKVSSNHFKGKDYLSVQAVDIRKNGVDDEKYFSEKAAYEMFAAGISDDDSVFPSREICSKVYRFLKAKGEWKYGFDALYFSLNGITYGQLKYALTAFEESGLTAADENIITVLPVSGKVDLMNSPTLKSLKGRLHLV